MKKKFLLVIIIICSIIVSTGCTDKQETQVSIVVTENGWDSQSFHNQLAKIIVENGYTDYKFSTSAASSTMNWQSIISGEIDLDIESWTDNVVTFKSDVERGDVIDIGVLVPDSHQGLYVPRYVIEGDEVRGIEPMAPNLKTVKDLLQYPDVFQDYENPGKGLIYGGVAGWMVDEVLYKKYEAYGLSTDFNYKRLGSESTIFASIESAYNLGEAWVGYGYDPSWVSGKLDLVLLEDEPYEDHLYLEGLCEFPAQKLKIISSNKFAEKAPDLVEFFQKYQTSSNLVSETLAHIKETGESHEETAIWFLKNNDYLLDEWLPKDNANRVRTYLSTK